MGKLTDTRDLRYYRSENGVITFIYLGQKARSKRKRQHKPLYLKEELKTWLYQNNFKKLYDDWVKSGFKTSLKPSVDRINNSLGYSLDNIRLVTWEKNHKGSYNRHPYIKRVYQYDKEHNLIKIHKSAQPCANALNLSVQSIRAYCQGNRNNPDFLFSYKLISRPVPCYR